jgi:glycosyltransferase involved in cell wall biosynthesis
MSSGGEVPFIHVGTGNLFRQAGSGVVAKPLLSIVFAYYDNPLMLTYQLEKFSTFPEDLLLSLEIIIVDDASPRFGAERFARRFSKLPVVVYRLDRDRPWNQDAARNIGVKEAHADNVLLTDIDHVVPPETARALLGMEDKSTIFTFGRRAHFSRRIVHSHVNSYFMARDLYWKIGGYDEDFWGTYGTDWYFRRRAQLIADVHEMTEVRLELVTKGSVADAKNKAFSRNPSLLRRARSFILIGSKSLGLMESPKVLSNSYQQTYSAKEP